MLDSISYRTQLSCVGTRSAFPDSTTWNKPLRNPPQSHYLSSYHSCSMWKIVQCEIRNWTNKMLLALIMLSKNASVTIPAFSADCLAIYLSSFSLGLSLAPLRLFALLGLQVRFATPVGDASVRKGLIAAGSDFLRPLLDRLQRARPLPSPHLLLNRWCPHATATVASKARATRAQEGLSPVHMRSQTLYMYI